MCVLVRVTLHPIVHLKRNEFFLVVGCSTTIVDGCISNGRAYIFTQVLFMSRLCKFSLGEIRR